MDQLPVVAITATAHPVSTVSALAIGGIGGTVMLGVDYLMDYLHIDDALGTIHVTRVQVSGGTLAAAIFRRGSNSNAATTVQRVISAIKS